MNPLKVFIGLDSNEVVAYHVLANSLIRNASQPISIIPLAKHHLPLNRQGDEHVSTEFSFTRFLVPFLCEYQGIAVFMDSDMLCRTDICQMPLDPNMAVSVVKHDYVPKTEIKFLDQKQSAYPRKNWSSMMVFNNRLCGALTPDVVNSSSGSYLHQMKWAHDDLIGELSKDWNHLVGEYEPNPDAKIVHYTLGTPCFKKYANCEFSQEWHDELGKATYYNRYHEFSKEPSLQEH